MSRNSKRRKRLGLASDTARAFDRAALARICAMEEDAFPEVFGLDVWECPTAPPFDWYAFKDNGADILAVAHLDTVAKPATRAASYVDTAAGPVVFSRALDDRLGAYIILELLPALGITCDVLLTTGEECGQSTAAYFEPDGKAYKWVIEFDRGGSDVVMYQYHDGETAELVESCGARVGVGMFSDIAELGHLDVKCFNWGTGYAEYHTARSHAFLTDTFDMVEKFRAFYAIFHDVALPHVPKPPKPLAVSDWRAYAESSADWDVYDARTRFADAPESITAHNPLADPFYFDPWSAAPDCNPPAVLTSAMREEDAPKS